MAYNNYNKELAEFQKWACLVRNDRLISTSKNKNQVRNCKDLLIKLKNDPMNILQHVKHIVIVFKAGNFIVLSI